MKRNGLFFIEKKRLPLNEQELILLVYYLVDMILAIDVYYEKEVARAVGVLFEPEDEQPQKVIIEMVNNVAEYIPGEFYKRELPCILAVTNLIDISTLEMIIVDGHVYVDNNKKFGLGGYVWEALGKAIPIIGVAKKKFFNTDLVSFPVYRGESKNPIYVSAIGLQNDDAIDLVQNLKGEFRMPSILKQLDQHTKGTI